jgi:hypothetical protein
MAIEEKRGCGYRKVGGLYLVGEGPNASCCQMPILLRVCPTCHAGIKETRSYQWIDPKPFLRECTRNLGPGVCPNAYLGERLGDKVGLIWIGKQFYPTPLDFQMEAKRMGVSRRVKAIPRGFELGKSWIWFAHPSVHYDDAEQHWIGGVFMIFKPTRIEGIVTETDAGDGELMEALEKRHITPIVVPDGDPDHAPARKGADKRHGVFNFGAEVL